MNGRVYDPNLGRFLSVDPMFEFPTNTQSLNPYSYVLNNPLSLTDPTGYTACSDVSTTNGHDAGMCSVTDKDGNKAWVGYNVHSNGDVGINTADLKAAMPVIENMANGAGSNQAPASAQAKPTGTADINSPANIAVANSGTNASSNSGQESICVTGSGSEGSCGQGSGVSADQERQNLLNHTYTHEVKSTPQMDAGMVAEKGNFNPHAAGEKVVYTNSEGTVTMALLKNSRNSCAVAEVPLTAAGVGHNHLVGNSAETLARELPGPLDTAPLTANQVVYIFTPTGAVRKIEVLKIGNNRFEPVITTLDRGNVFRSGGQIHRIDNWNRTWDDNKNLNVMEKVDNNP